MTAAQENPPLRENPTLHENPTWLFVYGTLRAGSGHAMQQQLATRAEWLQAAWVEGRLFRVSYYPGLVAGAGRVRGDLYRLPEAAALLAELDAFEEIRGEADDEYRRQLTAVQTADGQWRQAWVYWYQRPVAGLQEVRGGDWLAAVR
ncbi:MAG TPA: gamma-glutamylcyclotransferase family protein [Moraxellaceae bacterium]